ncbi:cytochrome b562 [Vibrio nigripulchritudo]|uniref:cytochrome b562 n=1 Tax=Vibrio nigripulchritudo TaxID=28173 RepID=UPI0005F9E3C7|nr:cytochrome b562 [Vibrio nigripulchritudo]KJY72079.1 cytochrome b562 family protein [Vibrio nigripulchritudo]
MKTAVILLTSLFAFSAFAKTDLSANMKQMKLAFNQAAEATTIEGMRAPIEEFEQLVILSANGSYPPEREELYQSGFSKLTKAVERIETKLNEGDLDGAKTILREIDDLREEYHDKKKPSIWSMLFD